MWHINLDWCSNKRELFYGSEIPCRVGDNLLDHDNYRGTQEPLNKYDEAGEWKFGYMLE